MEWIFVMWMKNGLLVSGSHFEKQSDDERSWFKEKNNTGGGADVWWIKYIPFSGSYFEI